ncbi:MAG: FGGY family carbohydrate kinase [Gammaproteobacteria bacterium]
MAAADLSATPLFLSLDQGSHAGRAQVFNTQGICVAQASAPCETLRSGNDRVEHDAATLVAGLRRCLEDVAQQLGSAVEQIVAAALVTQRSSVVCWDKLSGVALTPVLSWQDRRGQAWLKPFEAQAEFIHARTGLMLSAHYGASKLRWCLDHVTAVQTAARAARLAYGPLASFLLFHLLDERPLLVDTGNAARTLLWNLQQRDWDPALANLFGVALQYLPVCVANRYPFGTLRIQSHAVPLLLCHGDQPAALFANGQPSTRCAYINVGTGAFVQHPLEHQPTPIPGLLTTLLFDSGATQQFAVEGTVNGAASAIASVASALDLELSDVMEKLPRWLAESVAPPLFLNGVSGLGSPFWCADFVSRFVGTGATTEQMVAVVESIVFLLQSNLLAIEAQVSAAEAIVISGGVAQLDGLCQALATLSGRPVRRPADTEASARGAAWLLAQSSVWTTAAFDEFVPGPPGDLHARYQRWRAVLDSQLLAITG